jgi:DNA repair protein RadC
MYSQYKTTVMNRHRLHELLSWVNRKYYLEYEVVQENRDVFYVLFHDLNNKITTSIQRQVHGATKPEH